MLLLEPLAVLLAANKKDNNKMNEIISTYELSVLLINLFLAIAAIGGTRVILGLVTGVKATTELSKRDNFAFGISVAGGSLAIAIILFATLSGDPAATLILEAGNVAGYLLGGIICLIIGMMINDLVIFRHFSLKKAIQEQNISAGIVQGATMVAMGIMIANGMEWEPSGDITEAYVILPIFAVSLFILFLVSMFRTFIYEKRHDGEILQKALEKNNPALAIRYAGHLIGTALAVGASTGWVTYLSAAKLESLINWSIVAVVITLVITPLAILARKFVLPGINVAQEVDDQKNIGVACIEAVIFIAIGFVFKGLAG